MAGDNLEIICDFEVHDDILQSIKWYHNGQEFFSFIPTVLIFIDFLIESKSLKPIYLGTSTSDIFSTSKILSY